MKHREHLEHTKEIKNKSIFLQIDKDTDKLIKIYSVLPSQYTRSNILKCCKKELKTTQGFKWLYLEDYKELKYKEDIEKILNFINSKDNTNILNSNVKEFRANTILKKQIVDKRVTDLIYYVITSCNLSETFICNSIDMEYKEFKKKFNNDTFTVDDKIKISEFLQDYFVATGKIDIKELYRDELNNID